MCRQPANLLLLSLAVTGKHFTRALSTIYPLFVDRFGRFLRFYHLEFDKEAISDGFGSENGRLRCRVLNFK